MIKVVYGIKDGKYNYLSSKGHAEYDTKGKDLVCASVSSILFGLMNAIDETKEDVELKQLTNKIEIIINTDSELIQNYMELSLIQLKTIEESYSQYLRIERK